MSVGAIFFHMEEFSYSCLLYTQLHLRSSGKNNKIGGITFGAAHVCSASNQSMLKHIQIRIVLDWSIGQAFTDKVFKVR